MNTDVSAANDELLIPSEIVLNTSARVCCRMAQRSSVAHTRASCDDVSVDVLSLQMEHTIYQGERWTTQNDYINFALDRFGCSPRRAAQRKRTIAHS